MNNFKILSITDTRFDEQFGFTDREVKDLLSYYNVEDKFKETKNGMMVIVSEMWIYIVHGM